MIKRTKFLLKKYNIKLKKSLSQNFLISKEFIEKMAGFARGTTLEIGGGLGFITEELSKKAKKVIVFEKDEKMVEVLEKEYDFSNVEIFHGDFLDFEVPKFDRVVSNIPYSISSKITFKLLEHDFELGVLSYQKEFSESFLGLRKTRLSVMAEVKCDAEVVCEIPKNCFYPTPKTDSCVLKITPNKKFETDEFFEDVVRALFTHKRKKIKNSLFSSRDIFHKDKEEMKKILQDFEIGEKRVLDLKIHEIKEIVESLRERLQNL